MILNTQFKHGLAHCPSCEAALVAPLAAAGRNASCTACRSRFRLPSSGELFEQAVVYLIEREEDGSYYDPYSVEYEPAGYVRHH